MLVLFVLLFVLFGWLTGGRLSRLEKTTVRWLPLCIGAFLLESLVPILHRFLPWPRERWIWLPVTLSYLMIFLFLWRNRQLRKTAVLAGTGSFCNFLVIALNGFRMPVSLSVIDRLPAERALALISGEIPTYMAASGKVRLLFLGDIIPMPLLGGFASIGDLFLAAGIFFCFMAIMAPVRLPAWWRKG